MSDTVSSPDQASFGEANADNAPFDRGVAEGLTVSAVLGLTNRGDADWARLRGLQHAALSKLTFYRVYVHAMLSVFVAQIYLPVIPPLYVGSWILALLMVHVRGAKLDRALSDAQRRKVLPGEYHRQTLTAVFSGLLWSVPVLVFAPFGSTADLAALLLVTALLIAGSVFFYTAAPISIVLFALIVGVSSVVHLAMSGLYLVMGATILFLIASVFGTIEVGRTYLMARLAESGIAEKDEVVSLLLREFEENEADWLWEVDPQRRLRSVSPRFAFALGSPQVMAEGKPLFELIAGRKWEEGQYAPSLRELADNLKNRENFSNLLVQVTIKGEQRWW
ncbi:MAG: diguanylate cyclase, partial [Pseudomonadota bacterium]